LAEAVTAVVTIGAAVRRGRAALAAAGCDTPRLDAELLLAEVLDPAHPVGRERLVLERDRALSQDELERFTGLLRRREAREPVAYILGRRAFRRLVLGVDRRVLIPRPETELLVEVGLALPAGAVVADVGTGSGAVGLALADERPDLVVRGLDESADALAVARQNAARLDLGVEFVRADLLDGKRYDAVLANLPYVADGAELPPEVAMYEPGSALFAGADGLDVIRRLVAVLGERSRPLPLLALEISPEQARRVGGLLATVGYGSVTVRRDLAGHDRVVVGTP
jgi:release factor glutamine methyltransferase